MAAPGSSAPRKFSEKIAIQRQRQAEETAAFVEVMSDLSSARVQVQKLRMAHMRGSCYGGSLPNVNQIASNPTDFQGPSQSPLDPSRSTRHHGLVERVHRDPRRMMSPLRRYMRQVDSSPYNVSHLSPHQEAGWKRNAPWGTHPSDNAQLFRLPSALSRTNSDSALHTSVMNPSAQEPYPPGPPGAPTPTRRSAFLFPAPAIEESQSDGGHLLKPFDAKRPPSASGRPKSCEVPGINIYPSADQPPCIPPVNSLLNTGGSLPDLTSLHFPSPLHTPLDPEESGFGSLSGGSSTGNLASTMTHLGISRSGLPPAFDSTGFSSDLQSSLCRQSLQSSLSNPNLQASLRNSSLQTSFSNPSLQSSLSSQSLPSSLSNQSLSPSTSSHSLTSAYSTPSSPSSSSSSSFPPLASSSLNSSPHRRVPLSPLTLPMAGDGRRPHQKQFSPTMSPTLTSITQGVPLDTSKMSTDQRLPPYHFNHPNLLHQPAQQMSQSQQPLHQSPQGMGNSHPSPQGMGSSQQHPQGMGNSQQHPQGMGNSQQHPQGMGNSQQNPQGMGNSQQNPQGMGNSQQNPQGMGNSQQHHQGMGNSQQHLQQHLQGMGNSQQHLQKHPQGMGNSQQHLEQHHQGMGNSQQNPQGMGNSQQHLEKHPQGMGNSQQHLEQHPQGIGNSQQHLEQHPQGMASSQQHSQGMGNSQQHPHRMGKSQQHPHGMGNSQQHPQGMGNSQQHPQRMGNSQQHHQGMGNSQQHHQGMGNSQQHHQGMGNSQQHHQGMGNSQQHHQGMGNSQQHTQGMGNSQQHPQGMGNSQQNPQGMGNSQQHLQQHHPQGMASSQQSSQSPQAMPQSQLPYHQSQNPLKHTNPSMTQQSKESLSQQPSVDTSQKALQQQNPYSDLSALQSDIQNFSYQQNSGDFQYQPFLGDYQSLLSSLFDECDLPLPSQRSQQFEQYNMTENGQDYLHGGGGDFNSPPYKKQNSGNCFRHDPIPNIILTAVDSPPPGFSKEITSALSSVPGFEGDPTLGLEDELNIEPLTLDGLNMLSDPYAPLTDPLVEDSFRSDRLQ